MERIFSRLDARLLAPLIFILLLGTVILTSVAPELFPLRFLYLAIGFSLFFFVASLDEGVLEAFAPLTYAAIIILLALTLFFGAVTRGAVRWIELGPLTFQPSEFAKPLLVLFFAWFGREGILSRRFLTSTGLFAIAVFFVFKQPDLGSAITLGFAFLGTLLGQGLSFRKIAAVLLFLAFVSPVIFQGLAPYQKERIASFVNPGFDPLGAGYNTIQAQIAIGSGGFLGKGLGQGSQAQLAFLPERHSDFVFASLSEELGFVGATLLLGGFAFLFYRMIQIWQRARSVFSSAALGGIFVYLFAQTGINLAMNMGILPITGIPLPLVSSGGSSLVSTLIALGVVNALVRRKA